MVPYMRMPGRASRRQYIYAERFTDRFDHGYQRAIRNADYKLIDRSSGNREFRCIAGLLASASLGYASTAMMCSRSMRPQQQP